jgi:tetratricopeptide (TPR) repeat protein
MLLLRMAERLIGPYRLTEVLQSTPGGDLYSAWDIRLNQRVELQLHPRLDRGADQGELLFQTFLDVMRRMSGLRHPALCAPAEFSPSGSSEAWYVCQDVALRSIQDVLRETRQISWREAALVLREVAMALAFAHERGLSHGNLRPSAIRLSEQGRVQVTQLSVPLICLTQTGISAFEGIAHVAGDLRYLAPEVLKLRQPEPSSDVFSLGLVSFELLTGQHPFPDRRALERYADLRDVRALDPGGLVRDLPGPLCELTAAMLEANPARRPSSMGAIQAKLGEILAEVGLTHARPALRDLATRNAQLAPARPAARQDAEATAISEAAVDTLASEGAQPTTDPGLPGQTPRRRVRRTATSPNFRAIGRTVPGAVVRGAEAPQELAPGPMVPPPPAEVPLARDMSVRVITRSGTVLQSGSAPNWPKVPAATEGAARATRRSPAEEPDQAPVETRSRGWSFALGAATLVAIAVMVWQFRGKPTQTPDDTGAAGAVVPEPEPMPGSAQAADGPDPPAPVPPPLRLAPSPKTGVAEEKPTQWAAPLPPEVAKLAEEAERLLQAFSAEAAETRAREALARPGGVHPRVLWVLGRALEARGANVEAANTYAQSDAPGEVRGKIKAGVLLAAAHQCEGAFAHLKPAYEAGVETAELFRGLAICHLDRSELPEAIFALRRTVGLDAEDAKSTLLLAQALERQGKREEAHEFYGKAVNAMPKHQEARLGSERTRHPAADTIVSLGSTAAGEGSQEGPAEVSPGTAEQAEAAQAVFAQGHYREAARLFAEAARSAQGGRSKAVLERNRGVALDRAGLTREAVEAYTAALQQEPGDGEVELRLGLLHAELGEQNAAKGFLEKVLAKNPGRWEAHAELGRMAQASGKSKQAIEAFAKVLELRPNHLPTLQNLARAQLDAGDRKAALSTLRKVALSRPADPEPVLAVAAVLEQLGQKDELKEALAQACQLGAAQACQR